LTLADPHDTSPWLTPGWDATAEAWIHARAEAAGLRLLGPTEEVRRWCLACVLRAPTDGGALYFKQAADLPVFADEPRLTRELARLYPDVLPEVVAIDADRGWLLTMDCAGPPDSPPPPDDDGVTLLANHAALQARSVADVAALRDAGCPARPLSKLPGRYADCLRDDSMLALLPADVVAKLADAQPAVQASCDALGRSNVPDALTHGDLSESNAAWVDGRYRLFDWTDACLTHPFMDSMAAYGMDSGPARDAAMAAAISPWRQYESDIRLREDWAAAELVACAHRFCTYHGITADLPTRVQHEHVDGYRGMAATMARAATSA
jgi:hypothetical protein